MRASSGGGACCGSPTDIRIGGSLARGVMPCSSSPSRAKGLSARRASLALAGNDESSIERFLPRRRASTAQSGNIIRAARHPAKGSDGATQHLVAKKGHDRLPVDASGGRRLAPKTRPQRSPLIGKIRAAFYCSGKNTPLTLTQ